MSKKKKTNSEPRISWTGLVWVKEEDLTHEGKMRFRLGDLFPELLN